MYGGTAFISLARHRWAFDTTSADSDTWKYSCCSMNTLPEHAHISSQSLHTVPPLNLCATLQVFFTVDYLLHQAFILSLFLSPNWKPWARSLVSLKHFCEFDFFVYVQTCCQQSKWAGIKRNCGASGNSSSPGQVASLEVAHLFCATWREGWIANVGGLNSNVWAAGYSREVHCWSC